MIPNILLNDIKKNRLAHAYLFIGRESVCLDAALSLAKSLNCMQASEDLLFCDDCSFCKRISNHIFSDVFVIRPKGKANFISIKDIQDLQSVIQVKALESKKRICILAGVDKLDVDAANSFLKTLEEPPDDTMFILTVSNVHNLLDTIISRCRKVHIDFQDIDLDSILEQEFFANARDKIIDDFICSSHKNNILDYIDELNDNIKKEDMGIKKSSEILLDIIESVIRDLLIIKDAPGYENLIWNQDKINFLVHGASKYSHKFLYNIIEKISDFREKLDFNLNFKIKFAEILINI